MNTLTGLAAFFLMSVGAVLAVGALVDNEGGHTVLAGAAMVYAGYRLAKWMEGRGAPRRRD